MNTHTHTHTELRGWGANECPPEIILTPRGEKRQPKRRQCTFLCFLCSLFPNLKADLEVSHPEAISDTQGGMQGRDGVTISV